LSSYLVLYINNLWIGHTRAAEAWEGEWQVVFYGISARQALVSQVAEDAMNSHTHLECTSKASFRTVFFLLMIGLLATAAFAQTAVVIPYMDSAFAGIGTTESSPYLGATPSSPIACISGAGYATDSDGNGCLATAAVLNEPYSIVFDSSGNAYIADHDSAGSSYVRKVDAVTGIISMFAGGLSAKAAASPCAGYTYNGYTGQDTVVAAVAGVNTTAGDGCPATDPTTGVPYSYFEGIRDLAVDPSSTWLYIADFSASHVRRVSLADTPAPYAWYIHELQPVAGNGSSGYAADGTASNAAVIKNPYSIAVDSQNFVVFGDQSGNAVRRFAAPSYSSDGTALVYGALSTIVNCPAGGTCPTAPSAGCPGANPGAGPSKTLAASIVTSIAFDSAGNMYIAASKCYSVYRIAANAEGVIDGTTQMTTLMGDGEPGNNDDGSWIRAFSGAPQSSMRGVISAGGLNMYITENTSVWFYEADATGANDGWIHRIMATASTLGVGCGGSDNLNGAASYWGCPAPYAEFQGGSNGGKGSVDAYGNLYIADGGGAVVQKLATGLDFEGTAPEVQVPVGSFESDTVLIHMAGGSEPVISITGPFTLTLLEAYLNGTANCMQYTSGDLDMDCLYALTYTPTASGQQIGTLTVNGTSFPVDGLGGSSGPPVTITCDNVTKNYCQANPAFTYTVTPPVSNWTVPPVCGGVGPMPAAGSSFIPVTNCQSLFAPGDGPFSCVQGTLTVTPGVPAVSENCGTYTYDGTAKACTASALGCDGVTPVAGTFSYAPGPETNAGSYAETATFTSSDPNFMSGGSATATLTINPAKAALSLSCPEATDDGSPHSCTGTATGVGGAPVAGTWICTYSGGPLPPVGPPLGPGSYNVVCTFTSSDPNYVGGTVSGTLIIDPVGMQIVVVQVPNMSMTYGGPVPALPTQLWYSPPCPTGLVCVATVDPVSASCTTTATSSSPVGSYAINCSITQTVPNIIFQVLPGTMQVLPATPVLSMICVEVTYDATPHSCTGSATGVGGVTVAGTFVFSLPSEINAGTYPEAATFTSSDPNYASGGAATGTLIIDKATPNVTVACPTVIYGGTPPISCTVMATGVGGVTVPGHVSCGLGGWPVWPVNAGVYSYNCVFISDDPNYRNVSFTLPITINPFPPGPIQPPICAVPYDGQPHYCPLPLPPGVGGNPVNGQWNCNLLSATNAGKYPIACTFASADPNYASGLSGTATLTIT
jgi:hypothetical protein